MRIDPIPCQNMKFCVALGGVCDVEEDCDEGYECVSRGNNGQNNKCVEYFYM